MVTKFASLGSISSGTMRPEDLIPEFSGLLERLYAASGSDYHAPTVDLIESADAWSGADEDSQDMEEADELLSELFDALEAYAPPFCYFGAHEGDGADYGFWLSQDSLQDAIADGEVLQVDLAREDRPEVLDDEVQYILEVSDHGNMELYTRDGQSVWGIV